MAPIIDSKLATGVNMHMQQLNLLWALVFV